MSKVLEKYDIKKISEDEKNKYLTDLLQDKISSLEYRYYYHYEETRSRTSKLEIEKELAVLRKIYYDITAFSLISVNLREEISSMQRELKMKIRADMKDEIDDMKHDYKSDMKNMTETELDDFLYQ